MAASYVERVLDVVDRVPAGRVLTYGDVAELVGVAGPRQVGRVLATWGDAVAWWRVLRADGTHAPRLRAEATRRLRAEGTPMRDGGRVDLAAARWAG